MQMRIVGTKTIPPRREICSWCCFLSSNVSYRCFFAENVMILGIMKNVMPILMRKVKSISKVHMVGDVCFSLYGYSYSTGCAKIGDIGMMLILRFTNSYAVWLLINISQGVYYPNTKDIAQCGIGQYFLRFFAKIRFICE